MLEREVLEVRSPWRPFWAIVMLAAPLAAITGVTSAAVLLAVLRAL